MKFMANAEIYNFFNLLANGFGVVTSFNILTYKAYIILIKSKLFA